MRLLVTFLIASIAITSSSGVLAQTNTKKKKQTSKAATTKKSSIKHSTPKPPLAVPAYQSDTSNTFFPSTLDRNNDDYLTASKYRISDASFIVLPKQKFIKYSIMFRPDHTEKLMNDKGYVVSTTTQNFWNLQANGEYGLTSNLRVGMVINWQIYGSQYLKTSGIPGESYTSKAGFYDPEFKAMYRILDSTNSTWNGDFSVHLTPSLGTAKLAAPSQVGNVVYGAPQVKFALDAINPDANLEWMYGARFLFASTTKVKGPDDASSYNTDSFMHYWFELMARKHFLVKFIADAGIELQMPYKTSSNYQGTVPTNYLEEFPLHIVPKIQIGKELTNDGVFRIGYRYEGYTTDARSRTSFRNLAFQNSVSEHSFFAELGLLY